MPGSFLRALLPLLSPLKNVFLTDKETKSGGTCSWGATKSGTHRTALHVPCTLGNPQEQVVAAPLPGLAGPQQWYPVSACEVSVIGCLPVSLAYHPRSPAVGSPVRLLLAQVCTSQGPSHGKGRAV